MLAAPVMLPVLTEAVIFVTEFLSTDTPGTKLIAETPPLTAVDTAFCAPGKLFNPLATLAGNVALTALSAFYNAVSIFVVEPTAVVTALLILATPLIADDAVPEAMAATFIPEADAAALTMLAVSLSVVPAD